MNVFFVFALTKRQQMHAFERVHPFRHRHWEMAVVSTKTSCRSWVNTLVFQASTAFFPWDLPGRYRRNFTLLKRQVQFSENSHSNRSRPWFPLTKNGRFKYFPNFIRVQKFKKIPLRVLTWLESTKLCLLYLGLLNNKHCQVCGKTELK